MSLKVFAVIPFKLHVKNTSPPRILRLHVFIYKIQKEKTRRYFYINWKEIESDFFPFSFRLFPPHQKVWLCVFHSHSHSHFHMNEVPSSIYLTFLSRGLFSTVSTLAAAKKLAWNLLQQNYFYEFFYSSWNIVQLLLLVTFHNLLLSVSNQKYRKLEHLKPI